MFSLGVDRGTDIILGILLGAALLFSVALLPILGRLTCSEDKIN